MAYPYTTKPLNSPGMTLPMKAIPHVRAIQPWRLIKTGTITLGGQTHSLRLILSKSPALLSDILILNEILILRNGGRIQSQTASVPIDRHNHSQILIPSKDIHTHLRT